MSTLSSFSKMRRPYIPPVSKPNYKLSYTQRINNLHQNIWVDEVGTKTRLINIHSNYLYSLIIGLGKKIEKNKHKDSSAINSRWFVKLQDELNSRDDPVSEDARVKLFLLGL